MVKAECHECGNIFVPIKRRNDFLKSPEGIRKTKCPDCGFTTYY